MRDTLLWFCDSYFHLLARCAWGDAHTHPLQRVIIQRANKSFLKNCPRPSVCGMSLAPCPVPLAGWVWSSLQRKAQCTCGLCAPAAVVVVIGACWQDTSTIVVAAAPLLLNSAWNWFVLLFFTRRSSLVARLASYRQRRYSYTSARSTFNCQLHWLKALKRATNRNGIRRTKCHKIILKQSLLWCCALL